MLLTIDANNTRPPGAPLTTPGEPAVRDATRRRCGACC